MSTPRRIGALAAGVALLVGGAIAALGPVTVTRCVAGSTAPDTFECEPEADGAVPIAVHASVDWPVPPVRVPISALGPDPTRATCRLRVVYEAGEVLPGRVEPSCRPDALATVAGEAARQWARPSDAERQGVLALLELDDCVQRAPIGDPVCADERVPRFRVWLGAD